MIYITGDTHGNLNRIKEFAFRNNTSTKDIMIILGDVGINFYLDKRDIKLKERISRIPITLFCVHGNHEARPATLANYKSSIVCGGEVLIEPKYPNIVFLKDGETFSFNGLKTMVAGGAYSVDKDYRIANGLSWWEDEQPSQEVKQQIEENLNDINWNLDVILSHTCPLKYEPSEMFLPSVDQSKVDKETEMWLDKIENKLNYQKWYAGHYHTNKKIERMQFLFDDIEEFKV